MNTQTLDAKDNPPPFKEKQKVDKQTCEKKTLAPSITV